MVAAARGWPGHPAESVKLEKPGPLVVGLGVDDGSDRDDVGPERAPPAPSRRPGPAGGRPGAWPEITVTRLVSTTGYCFGASVAIMMRVLRRDEQSRPAGPGLGPRPARSSHRCRGPGPGYVRPGGERTSRCRRALLLNRMGNVSRLGGFGGWTPGTARDSEAAWEGGASLLPGPAGNFPEKRDRGRRRAPGARRRGCRRRRRRSSRPCRPCCCPRRTCLALSLSLSLTLSFSLSLSLSRSLSTASSTTSPPRWLTSIITNNGYHHPSSLMVAHVHHH